MNIIFFGTSEFGNVVLKGLIEKGFKPVLVITEPNKPTGRKQTLTPPPVKLLAEKHNLPVLQPEKIRNLELEIRNLSPDIIITASYGQILPKEILNIPKYGCLNVHPSLLPKYRGASPIQTAILNGEKETGVTIILMNEKTDQGDIIASSKYRLLSNMNYKELEEELAEVGAGLLLKTMPRWINGGIKAVAQDETKASYTKILTREDGKIDWSKSADEIERQIRAFYPWPGVFTSLKLKTHPAKCGTKRIPHFAGQNLKLKILEASIEKDGTDKQPGEVFLTKNGKIAVRAGQNCLILQKLQLEGKKPMLAEDFLRGHPDFIGTILK